METLIAEKSAFDRGDTPVPSRKLTGSSGHLARFRIGGGERERERVEEKEAIRGNGRKGEGTGVEGLYATFYCTLFSHCPYLDLSLTQFVRIWWKHSTIWPVGRSIGLLNRCNAATLIQLHAASA